MNKDISRLNGLVKLNNGEYQEAIEIFENVISLAISKGMTEGISSNYLNIGLAYSKLNNVDKARNYFSQAMDKSVFNFGSIPPEYRTHEMCVKVIKRPFSPLARHIPEHCWTEELMLIAVTSNEGALEYIPKKYN